MLRVFDFKCSNGHVSEHFVEHETSVQCPQCDRLALRQVAASRIALDGCSGHFPSAAAKWESNRESHMRKERKNNQMPVALLF